MIALAREPFNWYVSVPIANWDYEETSVPNTSGVSLRLQTFVAQEAQVA